MTASRPSRDRPHPGPAANRRANPDRPWRRRPDRAIDASARRAVELVRDATLKEYPGAPGLAQVAPYKDQFNTDLLAFLNA